jgi:hypothetical protein
MVRLISGTALTPIALVSHTRASIGATTLSQVHTHTTADTLVLHSGLQRQATG